MPAAGGQGQGIIPGKIRSAPNAFQRLTIFRERIIAVRFQRARVQFNLARIGIKSALQELSRLDGMHDPLRMPFQLLNRGAGRLQNKVREIVKALPGKVFRISHAVGQLPPYLPVRPALPPVNGARLEAERHGGNLFPLQEKCGGEDEVGVPRGLGHKQINGHGELHFAEQLPHFVAVGKFRQRRSAGADEGFYRALRAADDLFQHHQRLGLVDHAHKHGVLIHADGLGGRRITLINLRRGEYRRRKKGVAAGHVNIAG